VIGRRVTVAAPVVALFVAAGALPFSSVSKTHTTTAGLITPEATGGSSGTSPLSFDALRALVDDPNGPETIAIPRGVHHGDLVVKRPLVLRGTAGAILEGTGASSVVRIEANDVVVQDLSIRHSGRRNTTEDAGIKAKGERIRIANVKVEDTLFGIILSECKSCVLERAHVIGGAGTDAEIRGDGIKLWESHDSVVRGCVLDHSRDLVVWYTTHATLDGNVVKNSRYGSHFMRATDAVVTNSRFESNTVGVFVMYSRHLRVENNIMAGAHGAAGVGLGFKDSDDIDVRGNWLVANTTGSYLDNTPRTADAPVTFDGNVLALNDVGLRIHGTATEGLRLHGNDLRDNAMVIEVDGGSDALRVDVRGNHFSDYEGYDLNRDGVGDVAYEVKTLSSEMTEARPSLRFFHGTAAMAAIDAVAHAVPVFSAKKLLVDPAPLVKRPDIRGLGFGEPSFPDTKAPRP
jgi:nitrous oxidase accessory protein